MSPHLARYLPFFIFIGVSLTVLMFFLYLCFYDQPSGAWLTKINDSFYAEINRETGMAALSPLLVSVSVRATRAVVSSSGAAQDTVTPMNPTDDYAERLIVVSPQNWMIYTNDGIHFHFISNNIDLSRSNCVATRALNAIEYRLLSVYEQSNAAALADDSGKLRLSCVNYTYDQLMRIFGQGADKTVYHIADYFDKKKNKAAPDLTVDEILDLLIVNAVV